MADQYLIKCACGCGRELLKRDNNRRQRRFINGHHLKLINQFGKNNPYWKGGRIKSGILGYIYVHTPDHPYCNGRGYVMEHRLVMEEHLGRYLTENEKIHHINYIATDNRLENLYLFSSHKEHGDYHAREHKLFIKLMQNLDNHRKSLKLLREFKKNREELLLKNNK